MEELPPLLRRIRACALCEANLPLGPRPVLQAHAAARILIVGQAPGRKVHETGIPFNDPSGERLRDWLGVSRDQFYDEQLFAIVPMGFCYPGKGKSGDLPPRPECAATWRAPLMAALPNIQLTVALGQYAHHYHFPDARRSVTERVQLWRDSWPEIVPLPHPSPRNIGWLQRNAWFESDLLPVLRGRIRAILDRNVGDPRNSL
ncbi:uracil-DNA glycosylase family protein [Haliea atlantica]|jgi:uracil-DNA glycosylase